MLRRGLCVYLTATIELLMKKANCSVMWLQWLGYKEPAPSCPGEPGGSCSDQQSNMITRPGITDRLDSADMSRHAFISCNDHKKKPNNFAQPLDSFMRNYKVKKKRVKTLQMGYYFEIFNLCFFSMFPPFSSFYWCRVVKSFLCFCGGVWLGEKQA